MARKTAAAAAPAAHRPERSFNSKAAVWLFWLIMARLIIPGFFDYGKRLDVDMADESEALINHVTWLVFIGAGAVLVFSRLGPGMRVLRAVNPLYLALLLFATGSVVWSIDPAATLARLFHVATILLACVAVTIFGWHERRFQEVMRPVLTFFLLGSLIFGLVAPDLAIEAPVPPETHYFWGGLTIGKNALGAIASSGVILWLHGWASREVKPFTAACGAALSLTLLLLSRAATHMMATAAVCALLILVLRSPRGMRRYTPYAVGLLVLLTVVYGLVILDVVPGLDALLTPITALTGKDRTFTNRTLIWQITREHIALNPFLGTGYGGFWAHVGPGTPAFIFQERMFFNPGECHDGYLEIINDLGYLGLLLLFGYLGYYILRALRMLKVDFTQACLYLGLLIQQSISGLTESNWLWVGPDFMMFTLATVCLARHALQFDPRRLRRATAPAGAPALRPRAGPPDR